MQHHHAPALLRQDLLPLADGAMSQLDGGSEAGTPSAVILETLTQSGMLAAAAFKAHTSAKLLQHRLRLHLSLPLLGCSLLHISAC